MKRFVINNSTKIIKKYYPDYSNEQIEKIQYGLESIYLTTTKIIVIIFLSILLNIFKETITLLLFFNILRMTAFGIHASKSWICWITSIPTFIVVPLICKNYILPMYVLITISLLAIISFAFFAPADTKKRPLIRKKKRIMYKIISIIIALIYSIFIISTNNHFLKNTLAFSLFIETILICPLTYRIFNMPYNNYKKYSQLTV